MMHRSIKQHLVRNAKFTCFSKNRKNKKHTHNNNNKPQKPKNKTKHKKTLGLRTKEIVLQFEQGDPPPQTRQHTFTFVHSVVLLEKRNQ